MHIYLCSAKIQMERLVYCVHEHVDRLFALKRQRYIWCSCSFSNSTNVRQQDVARSLFLQKSRDEIYFLAFSSILIWYILYILCFCTFTNSTNVRDFLAELVLLGHFYCRNIFLGIFLNPHLRYTLQLIYFSI